MTATTASPTFLHSAVTTFRALSDPTRLRLMALMYEPANVTDMCAAIGMIQPTISHHLALLRVGGFVEFDRRGKHNFYSLTDLGRRCVEFAEEIEAQS